MLGLQMLLDHYGRWQACFVTCGTVWWRVITPASLLTSSQLHWLVHFIWVETAEINFFYVFVMGFTSLVIFIVYKLGHFLIFHNEKNHMLATIIYEVDVNKYGAWASSIFNR